MDDTLIAEKNVLTEIRISLHKAHLSEILERIKVLQWSFKAIYRVLHMFQIISHIDDYTWLPPHCAFYKSWLSQNSVTSLSWKTQNQDSILSRREVQIGPFQLQSFVDNCTDSDQFFPYYPSQQGQSAALPSVRILMTGSEGFWYQHGIG